jgi:hypothetical protein
LPLDGDVERISVLIGTPCRREMKDSPCETKSTGFASAFERRDLKLISSAL